MPCLQLGGGDTGHVAVTLCFSGPQREIHRESLGVKWCFYCRKRVEFIYTVTADAEPSYYDPNPGIHCEPAHHWNGDLFPGYEREWD
jgi:hypothetical protein